MSNATRMMLAMDGSATRKAPDLAAIGTPPIPAEARSDFAAKLHAGEFVASVELNPPKGFDLSKRIEAVHDLEDAGITTINIADGPRAKVLMSNVAMAHEIKANTNFEPIVHVCCRDRNFLGLQSHLLGMHVLGIRNIVVITGDPPKWDHFHTRLGSTMSTALGC